MDFTPSEKDIVQNHWIDISQDPDFISQDLGMDKSKVLDILKVLSDEGRIDDFDFDEETKVKKFNEMFRTYNS